MRYLLLSLLLVLGLSALAQIPDYVPTDGLVAWYPFDGSLIDASGMVGEGVASGTSFGSDRWSNEGSALQVVSDSFANLGMQEQLTLSPEDNLTVAMWSRPDSQAIMSVTKYQNGNGSGSSWFLRDSFESGVRAFGNGTSGTPNEDEWYQTCPNITDGWSHIVVVFEGGSVTLLVNGTLICQTTLPVSTSTQSQPVLVGRSNCTNGSNCNHSEGRIDDLGFWNRALSSEEALQLFLGAAAVYGCMDSQACNFNPDANVDDGFCVPSGCMDSQACNFNLEAECEGQSCDYSCCPGPGCCLDGQHWDWDQNGCVITSPSDTDFDGCVGMIDLLDLLSVFGTCNEIPWSCGDPLEYQGYSYETVQIGDQCWFAENLRAEGYQNGDGIPQREFDEDWSQAHQASTGAWCHPNGEPMNTELYGRLYNHWVVTDGREVCPTGWYVPSDADYIELEVFVGMPLDVALQEGARGAPVGNKLKSTEGQEVSWQGLDEYGFAWVAGGWRHVGGSYGYTHSLGLQMFRPSEESDGATYGVRQVVDSQPDLGRYFSGNAGDGRSIRCIKDSE